METNETTAMQDAMQDAKQAKPRAPRAPRAPGPIKVTDANLVKFAVEFATASQTVADLVMRLPESLRREIANNECQPGQEKALRAGFGGYWASRPNGSVIVGGRAITREEVLRDAAPRKGKDEESPYVKAYKALRARGISDISTFWGRLKAACRKSLPEAAKGTRETLDIRTRVQTDLEAIVERLKKAAEKGAIDFDRAAFGKAIKDAMAAIRLI